MTDTKLIPGIFCWLELGTTDQQAAKNFYTSLFGWTVNDSPMGTGELYSMFMLHGREVAAGYTLRPGQKQMGVPPHWMLYVSTDSADESAKKTEQLGATVLVQPFDVFTYGRMAVIQDPTGAIFSIWQAMSNQGIRARNEEGALCWADLNTRDTEAAKNFYSSLFGWEIVADEKDPSGYLHIKNRGEFIGGMPPSKHLPPQAPPHWLPYFQTADCDGMAARAKSLGAKFYLDPMTMENVGRFGILADPQGASFAIFQSMRKS